METQNVIEGRRSIRAFQDKPISKKVLTQLLELASKAPSGKNRQPWRFLVLQSEGKNEFLRVMQDAVAGRKANGINVGSCEGSILAMETAAAVVLVFNPFSKAEPDYNHYRLLTDTQSIGAAIQNLLLAVTDAGLGGLWICDVFNVMEEISEWLKRPDELVAAVAIGYPAQSPFARPRKPLAEITKWR